MYLAILPWNIRGIYVGSLETATPAAMATSTLPFLLDAGYRFATVDPQLSRRLMLRFIRQAERQNVIIAPKLRRQFCTFCGTLYIPDALCDVKVGRKRPAKRKRNVEKDEKLPTTQPMSDTAVTKPATLLNPNCVDNPLKTDKISHVRIRCSFCNRVSVFAGATRGGTRTSAPPIDGSPPVSLSAIPNNANRSFNNTPVSTPSQLKGAGQSKPSTPLTQNATSSASRKASKKSKQQGLRGLLQAKNDRQNKAAKSSGSLSDFLSSL